MNKITETALDHITVITKWYEEHGSRFSDMRKHNKSTYSWLMYFRKRVRDKKPGTDIIFSEFKERGVPNLAIMEIDNTQPNHLGSINVRTKQLQDFHKENGHYRVPLRSPCGLGKWMLKSRALFKENPDHPRIKALQNDFPNSIFESIKTKFNDTGTSALRWHEQFNLLVEYQSLHGTTLVPRKPNDPDKNRKKLGIWVYKQRLAYRKGKLLNSRFLSLQKINFKFSTS